MSISGSSAGENSACGVFFPVSANPESGTPATPGGGLPLVDLAVLRQLEAELGDSAVARSFARDYISIWDKRVQCLIRSAAENDPAAAMDAVLSLKTSAFMVGGWRLASLAVELESKIRNGDLSSAEAHVAIIAEVGQATIQALQQCYLARGA